MFNRVHLWLRCKAAFSNLICFDVSLVDVVEVVDPQEVVARQDDQEVVVQGSRMPDRLKLLIFIRQVKIREKERFPVW